MDSRMVGEAQFFVSDKKIKLEDKEGYYTFWVVFINSENEEQERTIRTMYGYTELLPGQITADTLISSDGNSYLDFLSNKFKFGDKTSGLDWNVTKPEQLSIRNATFEIKDNDNEVVAKIDGESGAASFGKGANVFNENGDVSLSGGVHKFNADKSMNLAGGNILYDLLNGLQLMGKFESNKDGNRIIIDPDDRTLKFINDIGQTLIQMSFEKEEYPVGTFYRPRLIFNHFGWNTGSEPYSVLDITGYEIRFHNKSTGYSSYLTPEAVGFFNIEDQSQPSFGASKGIDANGNSCLQAGFTGLPTSKGNVYVSGLYTTTINGHTTICQK
ncbi:hypothetical protein [Dysgonomonas reticulitermitis]